MKKEVARHTSDGDVIATGPLAFPRFVITFMTVTSCTTKKLSDRGDVTCDPQVGAGVSSMRLRSRVYASELRWSRGRKRNRRQRHVSH